MGVITGSRFADILTAGAVGTQGSTLNGMDGDDILTGSFRADGLVGGAGDDQLMGNQGNDNIRGGTGNDQLGGGADGDVSFGDEGQDNIGGGGGNDSIWGGAGRDLLTGGTGADEFIFLAADSRPGGGVRDIITDFERGVDKIDLTALDLSFEQLSFKAVGSGLIVYGDVSGDAMISSADFGLQLTGIETLSASDFIL